MGGMFSGTLSFNQSLNSWNVSGVITMNGMFSDVQVVCQDLSVSTRHKIMTNYRGHLILSSGEAFGYAAANAEVAGSFAIMNALPAFTSMYRDWTGVAWIANELQESGKHGMHWHILLQHFAKTWNRPLHNSRTQICHISVLPVKRPHRSVLTLSTTPPFLYFAPCNNKFQRFAQSKELFIALLFFR